MDQNSCNGPNPHQSKQLKCTRWVCLKIPKNLKMLFLMLSSSIPNSLTVNSKWAGDSMKMVHMMNTSATKTLEESSSNSTILPKTSELSSIHPCTETKRNSIDRPSRTHTSEKCSQCSKMTLTFTPGKNSDKEFKYLEERLLRDSKTAHTSKESSESSWEWKKFAIQKELFPNWVLKKNGPLGGRKTNSKTHSLEWDLMTSICSSEEAFDYLIFVFQSKLTLFVNVFQINLNST